MKKTLLTLSVILTAITYSFAQWNNGTNISNSNTGFVGIQTSLYVADPGFLYGSIPNGSVVVGQGQVMGVYIPPPASSSYQHYIKLDQPNNQVLISLGNGDGGGGVMRPGFYGETRIFSNSNNLTGSNAGPGFLTFYSGSTESGRFDANGNFLIGTTSNNAGYKLAVNGRAVATSMTVEVYPFADYVFNHDYQLPSLNFVKAYIEKNHHLPEIPSEAEVKKDGLNLGEMNKLLLKKVEELTLYLIEKDKKEKEQEARIDSLEQKLNQLSLKLEEKN